MRKILAVTFTLFLSACAPEEPAGPVSDWRLSIQLPDVELPVLLHLALLMFEISLIFPMPLNFSVAFRLGAIFVSIGSGGVWIFCDESCFNVERSDIANPDACLIPVAGHKGNSQRMNKKSKQQGNAI